MMTASDEGGLAVALAVAVAAAAVCYTFTAASVVRRLLEYRLVGVVVLEFISFSVFAAILL